MEYVYVGKIVNTHGIKGEIRILSNFELKQDVFKKGINIYIGDTKQKEVIENYRHHKNYEMITMAGYTNINDVLKFKNKKVYINRLEIENLNNKILKSDIIGMKAFIETEEIGIVEDIYATGINYEVIEIRKGKDKKLIPYHKDFILSIDIKESKIVFKGGML